ncbi:hypothetical protein [Zooshikella harenae]|nr:hypothetical protein [Zooshikella harenae]
MNISKQQTLFIYAVLIGMVSLIMLAMTGYIVCTLDVPSGTF